ncbi:hypothetical protein [Frigoribacterium sp. VKM Ac-2530]|uniref:hypothetical protein n=1 Tax=Frigoribacterium sp. VKM Ac-2530 TaxID=2783822 RepID=UPI00188D506E|nr:hypothetical protein [Frigoribacterium sp. VKM Ac-2530]MBF4577955.1 hypothetical protein [Frigoribacterium sp. VKM Ac-2530]
MPVPYPEKPAPVVSQQTLAEIKPVVKAIEVEIASFVPVDLVIELQEKPGGSILDCPGGVNWGSSTAVVMTEHLDLDQLERDLKAGWPRAADFEFERSEGPTGNPRLLLRSKSLGQYWVRRVEDGLQVMSFSACFAYDPLRDGYAWDIAAE